MSKEGRAGVEVPLGPLMDGCRLRLPGCVPTLAAAARSAEACDWPMVGMLMCDVAALVVLPVLVAGVVVLRPDTEDDERW